MQMEPISLSILLKTVSLIRASNGITYITYEQKMSFTKARNKSIIRELIKSKLIYLDHDSLYCTNKGCNFLNLFLQERWDDFSNLLAEVNKEYCNLLQILSLSKIGDKGYTFAQIISRSKKNRSILNQVTSEVCSDWGRRIGIIQKNLYTSGAVSRFYLSNNSEWSIKDIEKRIEVEYLILQQKYPQNLRYVSIPKLRENVCELIKISRRYFDEILVTLWRKNIEKIELASGPLTSHSRKTPTKKLSIHINRNDAILSPKYNLRAEEGLNLGGKKYQTIVFHKYF